MNTLNSNRLDNWLRGLSDSSETVVRVFCMMRGMTSNALMHCALDLAIASNDTWNPMSEEQMDHILNFYKKYDMERDAVVLAA